MGNVAFFFTRLFTSGPLDLGQSVEEGLQQSRPNAACLKSAVDEEWTNMSMDYMVKVFAAFRPHVEVMIEAEGSHFEI
ncbi:Putative transposable element [Caligus rogercresseyi]|uniref:Transposable element n=1 Tax=Caligus rogercresseyi TaxID=217165 RepID=A0A7T8HFR0_CALRO|nr:Putative transposable element [Caligus rogercresseyi]